jgi:linoleoyl-CoA desaturase
MFYALLVTASYTVIFLTQTPLFLFTAYISFGLLTVLLGFNFAHDLCHNTVFRNNAINHWGFVSIYTLLGAHAEAWKFRHMHSHHYAPNVKDYDSDLQITSLIRVEPGSRHRWFHRLQHIYAPIAYTTYSLYWVFVKDFIIYFKDPGERRRHKRLFHVSFWIQKAVYLSYMLVVPILFSQHSVITILIAFLTMHLVQSLFLLFTFFMTHHTEQTAYFETDQHGYIATSWFLNQVKSSNDFYPFSKTANFIFGGFNNHIAHHLFPNIHHVHYPRLNRILYRILLKHDIRPNVTTFAGGIRSHLRHLKNMSMPGTA